MEKFYNFLNGMFELWPHANDFEKGFRTAMLLSAALFLLLIIIGVILKLIFRKPAVSGVTLSREDGDIFISRHAVYTAVCKLESEFPEFEIMKVVMNRNRNNELGLTVTLLYDEREKSFDEIAAEFKQRVFGMLTKSFGIESVKSVSIVLAKIPGRSDVEDDDDQHDTAVIGHGFTPGI